MVKPIRKLLIANRGEIARRIVRTAHAMGIETVAVYSDADAHSPHVKEATQAIHIGPSEAAKSYLLPDRIIEAARKTGADAIHPGYGFLSENAGFASKLADAGIIFVGPPAAAIRSMGLKDAAKVLMKKAGVPVTPGYQGDDQSLPRLEQASKAVGYPLLIKAVAGGGGKGMRRVDSPAEFAEALIAAKREGEASFGNEKILIERLIRRPRHVEVQIFADNHGNVVHLFERDCSLQRRHQKVIEEAPAPGLGERARAALGQAAVKAARAIDYRGAGTIEFILDTEATDESGDHPFYFMEMNTRLQVEHPVTEFITGTDLVEWQIRVARGEPLPLTQDQIELSGHSVEARLYAEDPDTGFLPSTGTLSRLGIPSQTSRLRIDAGVIEGGEVSVHYDPMIAKIVSHGPTRQDAIDTLIAALDETVVEGVKTNRAFLARLLDTDAFRAGDITTGFIDDHADDIAPPARIPAQAVVIAALSEVVAQKPSAPQTMFGRFPGWRMNLPAIRYVDLFDAGGNIRTLHLRREGETWLIGGLGEEFTASGEWRGETLFHAVVDETPIRAAVIREDDRIEVRLSGATYVFALSNHAVAAGSGGDGSIRAPMPGRILSLDVAEGKGVTAGQRLCVLEAMKMENRLSAPFAGTVTKIAVAKGDQVAEGALLMQIEPQHSLD
ncbi:acetyl/propionyl/methylcrotonyl-CoA carboxylase subunit alpha [Pacificimonas sp. ICDLI1SI03]